MLGNIPLASDWGGEAVPVIPFGPEYQDYIGQQHIGSAVIDYIERSHVIESRVSPIECYLVQMRPSGSVVGSLSNPITVTLNQYISTVAPMSFVLWDGSEGHPDLRLYTHDAHGGVSVLSNGTGMTRVPGILDMRKSSQFAVVKRFDLDPQRVEVRFHKSFNATGSLIQYYYDTMYKDVRSTAMNRPEANKFALFGWTQWRGVGDQFKPANRVLVRMPMVTRDQLVINEEGRIVIEENLCWMVATPYVDDGDLLMVPADQTPLGVACWFEIINKQDSIVQNRLISQKFKIKLLPLEDERTKLPISITYP